MKRTFLFILFAILLAIFALILSNLSVLQWANPLLLWGFVGFLPLIYLAYQNNLKIKRFLGEFMDPRLLKRLNLSVYSGFILLRSVCWLALLSVLLLALARPQGHEKSVDSIGQGIDILVAFDISDSALAVDIIPNRLEAAKNFVRGILPYFSADRVGALVFTNEAFSISPLTNDYDAFNTILDDVKTGLLSSGGTSIPAVFDVALERFKKSKDVGKVLVIFSDGENHDGDLTESLKPLKDMGVKVFTIGVGTAQGSRIPMKHDIFGSIVYKRYQGKDVVTHLDDTSLQKIAKAGGGQYFHISKLKSFVASLQAARSGLATRTYKRSKIKAFEEKFQWYLLLGLFFLILERSLVIWENKWQRGIKKGTEYMVNKTPKQFSKVSFSNVLKRFLSHKHTQAWAGSMFALVTYAALNGAAWTFPWTPYFSNQEGHLAYQEQDYKASAESFLKGLQGKLKSPQLSYNLGNALYQGKDYEPALRQYQSTLTETKLAPEIKSQTLYNMGNTLYRQGQAGENPKESWEQAVQSYQKSLELSPSDQDTQDNLDFVKKQLEKLKQDQQKNKKKPKQNQGQGKSQNKSSQSQKNQNGQKNPSQQNQTNKNAQKKPDKSKKKYSDKEVKNYLNAMKDEERRQRNQGGFQRFKSKKKKSLSEMSPGDISRLSSEDLRRLMNQNNALPGQKNW